MSETQTTQQTTTTPAVTDANQTPAPQQTQLDSDRFASLLQKETKLQKEREAFKAQQLEFNKQLENVKKVNEQWQKFEELKKTDKLAAIKEMGFTEEDIFNFLANKEEPKEPTAEELASKAALSEVEKLKKEMADKELEQQKKRDEMAIKSFKESISASIKKETEKYEYLNHYGEVAQELVYETILGYLNTDPNLTPIDALKEALEAVEQYYDEEMTNVLKLKKFSSKIPKPEPEKEIKEMVRTRAQATIKRPQTEPVQSRKETPQEKRARLEAMLRNGLSV